jgi:hypothetical protein
MIVAVDRFAAAEAAFAAAHAEDPRLVDGEPYALRYHEHVARWVDALDPTAPEVVRLAARCQHIRRWLLPRTDFPEGRDGYKRWRSTLAQRHAAEAAQILADVGYDDATIARVGELLIKKRLRTDPLVQLLEDAVCLTFIELEFSAFAAKHDDEKVRQIVRKTWAKMSDHGHTLALALVERLAASPDAPPQLALIAEALANG